VRLKFLILFLLTTSSVWPQGPDRKEVRDQLLELTSYHRTQLHSYESIAPQGEIYKTQIPTDLAISGEGWFGVRSGRDVLYTRDGRFSLKDGFLRDAQGHPVLGYKVGEKTLREIAVHREERYTSVHFDESGVLYGERELASTPLWQVALYTVGHVAGVVGQHRRGVICPGSLELPDAKPKEDWRVKMLRQFLEVLEGPPQPVSEELLRAVENDGKLRKACLENLRNYFTPGYKANLITAPGRNWKQGALVSTGNSYDLALDGPGFFLLSDGSLTRDGQLPYEDPKKLLMGYRDGATVPEPVKLGSATLHVDAKGYVYGGRDDISYRLAVVEVAHPEQLSGDGHFWRATETLPSPTTQIYQGRLELANTDLSDQRAVAQALRHYAGLKAGR
jgi:flagellar basal body rod protein FlgG